MPRAPSAPVSPAEEDLTVRAVAVVGAIVAVGVAAVVAALVIGSGGRSGTVYAVVDGNTLDVTIGDTIERVSLLNVDAPDPGDPPECLADDAADHLLTLVPRGTVVTLEDVHGPDRFGRTHATLRDTDGVLVNAEMARAGLATVTGFDGDEQRLAQIRAAGQEAQDARLGLYSDICNATVPVPVGSTVTDTAPVDTDTDDPTPTRSPTPTQEPAPPAPEEPAAVPPTTTAPLPTQEQSGGSGQGSDDEESSEDDSNSSGGGSSSGDDDDDTNSGDDDDDDDRDRDDDRSDPWDDLRDWLNGTLRGNS